METVVVVQWAAGYVAVSDGGTGTRREVAWPATDVQTVAAATAVGTAALATLGVRDSVSVSAEDWPSWPTVGDAYSVPGWGGTPSTQRLVARRVGVDSNGFATVTPTFSAPEEEVLARQRLAIETLSTGPAGKSASMSAPAALAKIVPTGTAKAVPVPATTFDGIAVRGGPIWTADEATVITVLQLLCTPNGPPTSGITVKVKVSGTSVATISFPKDATSWTVLGEVALAAGQVVQFLVDDVGSNTDAELSPLTLTCKPTAASAVMRSAET